MISDKILMMLRVPVCARTAGFSPDRRQVHLISASGDVTAKTLAALARVTIDNYRIISETRRFIQVTLRLFPEALEKVMRSYWTISGLERNYFHV